MTLASDDRFHRYQPVVDTTDFLVPFPIFSADEVSVFIDGEETELFSVTATFSAGRSSDATVVLNTAANGVDVDIVGSIAARRDNSFLPNSPNLAQNIQNDLDFLAAALQETDRIARRGMAPDDLSVASGYKVGAPSEGKIPYWVDGVLVPGPSQADFAADVLAASTSADLSEAWAAGTEPGGPGTKSAREYSEDAEASAARVDLGALDDAVTAAELAQDGAETAEEGAQTAQGLSEVAQAASELGQAGSETAQGLAEDARDQAALYANIDHRAATWAALAAISGTIGAIGYVSPDDTGTHVDPITFATVQNEGYYEWAATGFGSAQAARVGGTGITLLRQSVDDLAGALDDHFIGVDHEVYPAFADGVFSPTDRGFWFDFRAGNQLFTDLVGRTPAGHGDSVKRFEPLRPVANGYGDNIADPTMATGAILTGMTQITATGSDGVSTVAAFQETATATYHLVNAPTITTVAGRLIILQARVNPTRGYVSIGATGFTAVFDISGLSVTSVTTGSEARISAAPGGFVDIEYAFLAPSNLVQPVIGIRAASGVGSYLGSVSHSLAIENMSALTETFDAFLQQTTAKMPTVDVSDVRTALVPDGVGDWLKMARLDLSGSSVATVVMVGEQTAVGATGKALLEHGLGTSSPGFGVFTDNGSPTGNLSAGMYSADPAYKFAVNSGSATPRNFMIVAQLDPTASGDAEITTWVDGDLVTSTYIASGTLDAADVFTAAQRTTLFARIGTDTATTGTIYSDVKLVAGLVIDRAITEAERDIITRTGRYRAGLAIAGSAASPVSAEYSIPAVALSEAGQLVTETWGVRGNAFSMMEIATEETSLTVSYYSDVYSAYPTFAAIGVYVDGVYNQSISASANGASTATITLPAGNKRVGLVNGLQSKPSSTVVGTWVTGVSASGPIHQVFRSSHRLLIYGDSIAVGANSSPVMQNGWPLLLRASVKPLSVCVEGYGYRSLYDDCVDLAARKAFVKRLAAYNPQAVWLAIGTNDYGLNKWTAAAFGTAYADMVDRLHAALPAAIIYAQTPLLRTTETANGSGSTTGDYRSQITTIAGARSWLNLIDGTSIMTTGGLDDGVHPSNAGATLYAAFVESELWG